MVGGEGWTFPPSPSLTPFGGASRREGVPAGEDDFRWVDAAFDGKMTAPSPLGEGWGEVLN